MSIFQGQSHVNVSFVVPAFNEERHLGKCLASIANQALPNCVRSVETLVIDNESTDKTAEVAAQHHARVVVVSPGRVSRARNVGARAATGDWLAFVDADCELPSDWLEKCSRHLHDASVLAVGAAMRSPHTGASWVERSWYEIAQSRTPQAATRVRWLPGFNLLVRRQAFEDVNGFDEELVSCEDCDLGYRLATRGRLILDPEPTTAHHGESQTLRQLFKREAWRSQGNLRVARTRAGDWRNWLSLLLPAAAVAGLVGALAFAVAATCYDGALWPWSLASFGVFALPFGVVLMRVLNRAPLAMLPRILVVFGVYLAARAAGLFLSIPRVTRNIT